MAEAEQPFNDARALDSSLAFLRGNGEMGELMRGLDWAATSLGSPVTWTEPLRTSVRLLLNTGHPMYIWWGPDHTCLYNDAYRLLIGDERHPDSLGRPAREVWLEIWETIGPQIEHVMAGRGPTWHENQLVPITRNGRLEDVYWTYSYSPIDDETAPNGIGGVLVICTETTQQVFAELRLAAQAERQRRLFEQAPGFIAILNGPEHFFEFTNAAYVRLLGGRELIGRRVTEVVPEIEGQGFIELLDQVFATGQRHVAYGVPISLRPSPEASEVEEYHLDFVYEAIVDEDGSITGIFVEGQNVTDQIKLREDLVRANETLEARVVERTAELVRFQEQLRQSQKLETMGQLTGGIAHDFNNLLTPILGSLDMLLRKQLGSEREQRLMRGALESAERAKTLVQRLLAFARRQPLQPRAVDMAGLLGGMTELIASTSGPQTIISVEIADDLPPVRADHNQLEMAILNCSVNARDAMPHGGQLTISAKCKIVDGNDESGLAPGSYVSLSIADSGVGMSEATLAKAVDPFFSTKGVGKGTGLGLSMVHGLMLQLGGELRLSSKLGIGTNVELWMPVSLDTSEETRHDHHSVFGHLTAGTALLVDDEELVRTCTAAMLTDLGYQVIEAACGDDALRVLEGLSRVDLVISDHLMPGMTGVELARRVQERWPSIPTLIVSGYADVEEVAPDLLRLEKPFRQAELAVRLAAMSEQQATNALT